MRRVFLIGSIAALALSACVPLSEMETLEAEYEQQGKQYTLAKQELAELREENASLTRMNQSLSSDMNDVSMRKDIAEKRVDSLSRSIEQLRHHYDTTMENYMQQVAGTNRDLTRAQNLLTARNKELAARERELQAQQLQLQEQQEVLQLQRSEFTAKENEFKDKESEFKTKEIELLKRQKELQQAEAATRAELEAKEQELEAIRSSVTKALVGFADKGLNVETKDGKVYVSMDNKLLFPSASWTVSKDGIDAIKQLARVLEQDQSLKIMVEGHTDNDAYRGSTAVKDNWDLSVMRATAIVKLLLKHGPGIDPSRIEACGHGEFAPKVPNDSPEHKAMNRRTEIILTPNIEGLLEQIGQ